MKKNQWGKDYYSSYWMTCIDNTLKIYDITDIDDIGYYSSFAPLNLDDCDKVYSHKQGGEFKKFEQDKDHQERESVFREILKLWRKFDYDIDNDDARLHNHMCKWELRQLNHYEPDWTYDVPRGLDDF